MNDNLLDIVNEYVSSTEAPYAIMITGEWGAGKTYYWKNKIHHNITIPDKLTGPIYISLYSIKNIEELKITLSDKIIQSKVNSFFLKKIKKWGETRNKSLILSWLNTHFFPTFLFIVKLSFKIFKQEATVYSIPSIANLKDTIICYDDIERCPVPTSSIIGFINETVENMSCKAIIISDESKLLNNHLYSLLKSKTVRYTYKFTPNLEHIYDYYQHNFGNFFDRTLTRIKNKVLESLMVTGYTNSRGLIYALSTTNKFTSQLESMLHDNQPASDYLTFNTIFLSIVHYEYQTDSNKLKQLQSFTADPSDYYFYIASSKDEAKDDLLYKCTPFLNTSAIPMSSIYTFLRDNIFNNTQAEADTRNIIHEIGNHNESLQANIKAALGPFWDYTQETFERTTSATIEHAKSNTIKDIGTLSALYLRFNYYALNSLIPLSTNDIHDIFNNSLMHIENNAKTSTSNLSDFTLDDLKIESQTSPDIDRYLKKAIQVSGTIDDIYTCTQCNELLSTVPTTSSDVINAITLALRRIRSNRPNIVNMFDYESLENSIQLLSNADITNVTRSAKGEISVLGNICIDEQKDFIKRIKSTITRLHENTCQRNTLKRYHYRRLSEHLEALLNDNL